MPTHVDELVQRYADAASAPQGGVEAGVAASLWSGVTTGKGLLGAAKVRDSARRRWTVEVHRDGERGRFLVVSPSHGDNEPFRASADGYHLDTHLRISGNEWALLALLAFGRQGDDGREDEELRQAAFRLVDRMVIEAQHRMLMGAAEDEED
jgi:hypothetical protein